MKILLILKEGNEQQFEGTKEFKIASNKRDLFFGFSEHQERLCKKFALEEGRIFAANEQILLYIKHEDLSEIAHGGQCLSISVLQLWILHLTETCMRAGNSDIYGFLEPQSIQRSGNRILNLKVT
ncbi:hypothetical protein GmHk_10G028428 [Glycine max]|nr:hypothetical protein GmHk_10G028428 [Glycine max]KAH1228442.1 hypothetical protein GmHk_10G028428 [Glycine max]